MWKGSGCYGRNGHEDAAADAALLAKAVGKPVRVQWSRADEHGWDPKGPPTLIDMRASMDSAGNVTAWEGDFYMPQQTAGSFLVPLVAATLSGMPYANDIAPGNVFQNSAIQYKIPNVKTVCKRLETTPFRPSWIRTPGRMQNTYANECFIDELAAAANMDALEFRVKLLDDKRGLELLNRLAALAKWEKRPSPQKSASGNVVKGRGISYVKYELVRTYVGAVAEVEVDRGTGVIKVAKFTVVHDCGQIINPDGLKNQIEGSVIQTVSRTLIEEVKFDRSQVTSLDWASYPILKFPQVPEIVIESDRPADRKTVGRGRAGRRGHPVGDLQRRVRCDRPAATLDPLHAGQGQGGDAGSLRPEPIRSALRGALRSVPIRTLKNDNLSTSLRRFRNRKLPVE